jgi:ribosome-associated protein
VSTVKKAVKKTAKKAAAKTVKKTAVKTVTKSALKTVKKPAVKAPAAAVKKATVKKAGAVKKAPADKDTNPVILLGRECLSLLSEKKAEDAVFLDLREVNTYLDYFIICTASSKIQCRSLAKDIEQFYAERGQKPKSRPDYESEWVIIDYFGLVIHIFTAEMRAHYDLDRLWADADRL